MALVDGRSKTHIILLLLVLGNLGSLKNIGSEGIPTRKAAGRQCVAHEVTEGQKGRMTFFIRKDINFSADTFFANLVRRHEHEWDILFCEQLNNRSEVDCKVHSDHYLCTGVKDYRLTVEIPDITKNFEDTYIFQAYVNSKPEPPDFCYLSVKKRTETPHAPPSATHAWDVATAISLTLLTIMIIGIVVFYLRKRIGQRAKTQHDQSQQPLIRYGIKTHETMRWYFKDSTKEDEQKLLQFHKNKTGSFLVRGSQTNKKNYVLAMCLDGRMNYLTLIPESKCWRKGWKCPSTGHHFRTVCGAVHYYKNNAIKVNNTEWGTLVKPFEQEPDALWYFGELAAEHEKKVLLNPGSFLIAVASNDREGYYLMVNVVNAISHFAIVPNDKGFEMLDTGRKFGTLSELVEVYTSKVIKTGDGVSYGTLGKPCSKVPYEGWCFEGDEGIFLQSKRTQPGSFFIRRNSNSQCTYLLTVYFDGEIRRFPVEQRENRFVFLATGKFFYSWYELVDFYKAHDIQHGSTIWGKLQTPFKREPVEDWYFGQLRSEDEQNLLLLPGNGEGTFLIRESVTDPENYTLLMFWNGKIHDHEIISEDTGFKIIHTQTSFSTLNKLVNHYTGSDIKLDDGTDCGKLTAPCTRDPPRKWHFISFTTEDENVLKQKHTLPGSFLIRDGSNPNTYTLVVYLDEEIFRFRVQQEGNGFKFQMTGMFFHTWYELVDYYRTHDIKVNERVFGKLARPLRKEYKEDWYFGSLSKEDEKKLPLTCRNGPGAFLIRDEVSEQENCVLAVNFHGTFKHFTIIPGESGLRLNNTGTDFPTLTDLVDYYKDNEIQVENCTYGKLSTPFRK